MKFSSLYTAGFILFSAGIMPGLVYGCTCVQQPWMKAARELVDVIFRGTVTERTSGRRSSAVFRVEQVWKGDVSEQFRVE
jgi:hypothetical protein